jgi:hypothetical protein
MPGGGLMPQNIYKFSPVTGARKDQLFIAPNLFLI